LLAHKSPVYVNNVGIRPGQSAHDSLVAALPGSVTLSRPWIIPITGKKAHYSFLYIEHCFVWDLGSAWSSLAQSTALAEKNDSVARLKYRQSSQACLVNLSGRPKQVGLNRFISAGIRFKVRHLVARVAPKPTM
jgi:hypothetical protein